MRIRKETDEERDERVKIEKNRFLRWILSNFKNIKTEEKKIIDEWTELRQWFIEATDKKEKERLKRIKNFVRKELKRLRKTEGERYKKQRERVEYLKKKKEDEEKWQKYKKTLPKIKPEKVIIGKWVDGKIVPNIHESWKKRIKNYLCNLQIR